MQDLRLITYTLYIHDSRDFKRLLWNDLCVTCVTTHTRTFATHSFRHPSALEDSASPCSLDMRG